MYMDKCEREQLYIERRKLFQGEEDSRCHDFKKIKNSMNFIVNDENMNGRVAPMNMPATT